MLHLLVCILCRNTINGDQRRGVIFGVMNGPGDIEFNAVHARCAYGGWPGFPVSPGNSTPAPPPPPSPPLRPLDDTDAFHALQQVDWLDSIQDRVVELRKKGIVLAKEGT